MDGVCHTGQVAAVPRAEISYIACYGTRELPKGFAQLPELVAVIVCG
jgi:hypothetical protein